MIDFRYHLVSLISVFLALAVGVVLGAGPLQNSIGTALQDQVSQLRTDRDAVRAELDATRQSATRGESFIQGMAPGLVEGRLEGRNVALVALPGANDEDVDAVAQTVGSAGGTVTATAHLTDAWVDPQRLQYRTTLAGQMLGYLDPAPAADAGTDGALGAALAQGLSSTGGEAPAEGQTNPEDPANPENPANPEDPADPANPEAPGDTALSEQATTLLSMLSGGDTPLLEMEAAPTAPAGAIIVVGPRPEAEPSGATASPSSSADEEIARSAAGAAVRAIGATVPGTTVLGAAQNPTDLVAELRGDQAVAEQISTVDSVGEVTGPVTAVLALAVDLDGTVGHYGFASTASVIAPQLGQPAPAGETGQ